MAGIVTSLEVSEEEEENAPVEYNNSKVVAPMQEIMDLYSRPKYTEIDPSSAIFITFPLMYGMILGDIGYALILGTLAVAIKKLVKSDAVKPLMNILIYCQISAFIFGILYGEFLGFLGKYMENTVWCQVCFHSGKHNPVPFN